MSAIAKGKPMQEIHLVDRVASSPDDIAEVVLLEAEAQLKAKIKEAKSRNLTSFDNPDVVFEFLMSCIALTFVRIRWRYQAEFGARNFEEVAGARVREIICEKQGYDLDDFDSAIQAVAPRARMPYGWTAFEYASRQAATEPIRLLQPQLAGKKLPTTIANLAYQLSLIQGKDPILLPIDQLRAFLQQRKLVVSGAVQRLVEAGVIEYQDKFYRTGKAREFRFAGKVGEHFEIEKPPTETPL